jgi:hypothetical protein
MSVSEESLPLPGFFAGLIDGMLARRFWDPELARRRKSLAYVLGEVWAFGTQPLALLAAVLDYEKITEGSCTTTA